MKMISTSAKAQFTLDSSVQQDKPTLTVLDISQTYLGYHLGFYQALSNGCPLTAFEIAIWTDTDEGFVQEWLEAQAVAGILTLENPEAKPSARRFRLDPTQAKWNDNSAI